MDYEWLKYLAAPLGVAFYAFLLNYELPSRRARKRAAADSAESQEGGQPVDLLGGEIGGGDGDFTTQPRPDGRSVIDGVSRRISQ